MTTQTYNPSYFFSKSYFPVPRPTSRNGVSLSPGLKSYVLTWDIQWIFKPLAIKHFNLFSLVQRMNLQIYMLIEWPSSSLCLVTQSYLTFWDPLDCSLPGSSVHGIFQARILEWVARTSSKGFSWLRDRTHVSWTTQRLNSCLLCLLPCRQIFYRWATGETQSF